MKELILIAIGAALVNNVTMKLLHPQRRFQNTEIGRSFSGRSAEKRRL